jgi:hypothetical protein
LVEKNGTQNFGKLIDTQLEKSAKNPNCSNYLPNRSGNQYGVVKHKIWTSERAKCLYHPKDLLKKQTGR